MWLLQLIMLLLQPQKNDSLNMHGSFNYCCNMLHTFSIHWLIYFGFFYLRILPLSYKTQRRMIEWLVNNVLWDMRKKSAMTVASKDRENEQRLSVRITWVGADIWNRNLHSMEHIKLYCMKNNMNWSMNRVIRSTESWLQKCDLGIFLVLHHLSTIYVILRSERWRNSAINLPQFKANWIK